ncbi:MAG: hypothetical protein JEY96_00870 [Bacteroidales bacterium]|nr:hypothetical protein [Bacteroidales bacterium]
MDELINEIVDEIKDYGIEDNHTITPERVTSWINQFKDEDREFILEEMLKIFEKRFCTLEDGTYFLKETIEFLTKDLKYKDVKELLDETEFLSLQEDGKSQPRFLELLKDVLEEEFEYNYSEQKKDSVRNYLYIDDVFCTGNTMYHDIFEWLQVEIDGKQRQQIIIENNSRIIFSYIFLHKKNYWKKMSQLKYTLSKEIVNKIQMVRWMDVDNTTNKPFSKCETIKPIEDKQSKAVTEYRDKIIKEVDEHANGNYTVANDFYRGKLIPMREKFFSSKENRIRLENIFLEKGIEILNNTEHVSKQQMRALGYSLPSYKDFGFGALCFTWRNVPNNTPLVFWYAGGHFIPLFEKHVYVKRFNLKEFLSSIKDKNEEV